MKLVDLFDHFIIDLDGVVYVENKPVTGARETIETLRKLGKGIIFLTNDPRSSSREYSDKLERMGISVTSNHVVTSGMAIAQHIKENYELDGKKAYVVGTDALKEEIRGIGLRLCDDEEAKFADYVVVGGHQQVSYQEIKLAAMAVRNGAKFFGTNRDPVFPTPEGLVPATGALLAAIEVASEKKAITVGKPESIMFDVAKKLLPSPDRTAIIGDRLDTDILGGKRAGLATILVLSGSTTKEEISRSEIKPDYVIDNLEDLLKE
jgi:4-nitrophenyl phosphatase